VAVQVDNGFMLWTFAGQRIHEEPRSRCYQILWRPRLHAVLTDEEAEAVVSTIKSRKSAYVDRGVYARLADVHAPSPCVCVPACRAARVFV
jgi:hypothetical protein